MLESRDIAALVAALSREDIVLRVEAAKALTALCDSQAVSCSTQHFSRVTATCVLAP
jgi:hypothetical protein